MTINEFTQLIATLPTTDRLPVVFAGHGSPTNAIEDNVFTRGWKMLSDTLPQPHAIMVISAHWLTEGTYVHIAGNPRTIHDFWGFPKELYDIAYTAPGAPQYAHAVRGLLEGVEVKSDTDWGIDHGAWVLLKHMFPGANTPVFQMSLDMSRSNELHYALGKQLSALREKGVLIIGSGNIVHNLGMINWEPEGATFDWATEFDEKVKALIESGEHEALIHHEKLGHAAALAVPSPEHYWPLLYCLALQQKDEHVTFPVEGITHGSISMRAVRIGK